jgi:hypothetical protein
MPIVGVRPLGEDGSVGDVCFVVDSLWTRREIACGCMCTGMLAKVSACMQSSQV